MGLPGDRERLEKALRIQNIPLRPAKVIHRLKGSGRTGLG
jgi:hypothetical protein